jgi:hypothetical protein
VLLIFDEIVTGFRLAYGGAQERYGVTPTSARWARSSAAAFHWPHLGRRQKSWRISTRPAWDRKMADAARHAIGQPGRRRGRG